MIPQWVEVTVKKASHTRPGRYKLRVEGIKILSSASTANVVRAKRAVLAHALTLPMLPQRGSDRDGHLGLGVIKPRFLDQLVIAHDTPRWTLPNWRFFANVISSSLGQSKS